MEHRRGLCNIKKHAERQANFFFTVLVPSIRKWTRSNYLSLFTEDGRAAWYQRTWVTEN